MKQNELEYLIYFIRSKILTESCFVPTLRDIQMGGEWYTFALDPRSTGFGLDEIAKEAGASVENICIALKELENYMDVTIKKVPFGIVATFRGY